MALLVPVALTVGVLTGLVGIGGGFLVVPALVLVARVPMRQAIGTSLLVITLNTAAGFADHLGTVEIDWGFLAAFATMTVAGALVGTALSRNVPAPPLTRDFGGFLLVVGGFVLYMNRSALVGVMPTAPDAHTASVSAAR